MPVGAYKVTINGTGGTFAHSIEFTLVIENSTVGGFGIATTPQTATVSTGANTT